MLRLEPIRVRGAVFVAIALVVVALVTGSADAATDPLARCGAKKLAALATTCEQLLQASSQGDDARRARAVEQLRQRWRRAESRDDGTCAARTAPVDDAARRLERAVTALAGTIAGAETSPRCAAKLVRLAARTCGAALRVERDQLRRAGAGVRSTKLAAVARRFTAGWARRARPSCGPVPDAAAVLAAVETTSTDAAADGTVATLRELASLSERPIGSAVEIEHLDPDPTYGPTLTREFDSLTPQSELKWGEVHRQPGQWDFAPADRAVALAEANGMRVRGHTLVWGGAADPPNPAWLHAVTDPVELRAVVREHVTTLMRRYAGRIPLWDVVNEPLATFDGVGSVDGLADNHFLRVLGPDYIADALRVARAADPSARLFINENFVEVLGPKQERLARLIADLQAAGVPLDGLGLQAHVNFLPGWNRPTRADVEATLRRFAAFGIDLEITELNVHTWGFAGDEAARLDTQRRFYRDVVAACVAVERCRATTLWLFTDRYPTSVEQAIGQDGMPLVLDDDYRPKPAYFGVRAGLLTAR